MEALELFISSICNLNCKYCYIPKSKRMAEIHRDIIKFIQNFSAPNCCRGIEYLGLWGAEPTLSSESLVENIDKILSNFPNLKQISFSTNGTNLDKLVSLVKAILERNIEVEIQFSLDGPEFINAMNRGRGLTNKVLNNLKEFIKIFNKIDFNPALKIRFKSTLTIQNMEYMLSQGLAKDFIKFWLIVEKEVKDLIKNDRIIYIPSSLFTLEVPGRYSSSDGKLFAKFLKEVHKHGDSAYTFRLLRILDLYSVLGTKPRMFTCSGGDSNFGFDSRKCLHLCHRTFFLNEEKYIADILNDEEYRNWDVSVLRKGTIDILNKYFIVPSNDDGQLKRFFYVLRCYHDFWREKLAATVSLIIETAKARQISKVYLDQDLALLFALFLNTAFSCPMENLLNTNSLFVVPVSLIRLWGNGAFEELLRHTLPRE